MKLRRGFVSNSSTTQFIADKKLLTEEQMEQLRKLIGRCYNTSVLEGIRFFAGAVDFTDLEAFLTWRDDNAVLDDALEFI